MFFQKKILKIFNEYYLEEKIIHRDIKTIREFFDMQKKEKYTIDEQCFYDLDMENVFRKLDRTYSTVGESVLYKMLREPIMDENILKERSNVIKKIKANKELRAKTQCIFHNLGFDNKNRFLEMMKKDLLNS